MLLRYYSKFPLKRHHLPLTSEKLQHHSLKRWCDSQLQTLATAIVGENTKKTSFPICRGRKINSGKIILAFSFPQNSFSIYKSCEESEPNACRAPE